MQPDQLHFARSAGEFGVMLHIIFDPAAKAAFTWKQSAFLGGQRVQVFARSDQDMQCFKKEIDVVQGDMQARLELDSRRLSYLVIAQGFTRGRNRPGDIPTAITLYHMAGWNKEIDRAILDWRNTDPYILRLVAIAVPV